MSDQAIERDWRDLRRPARTRRSGGRFARAAALLLLAYGGSSGAAAACFPGQRCIIQPRVQMQPRLFVQPRMGVPGIFRQGGPGEMRFGGQARRPVYRPGRFENGRILRGEGQRFYSMTQWYMVPSGVGNAGPPFDIEAFIDSLLPDGGIPPGDEDGPSQGD